MITPSIPDIHFCDFCDAPFVVSPTHPHRKFCSSRCRLRWHRSFNPFPHYKISRLYRLGWLVSSSLGKSRFISSAVRPVDVRHLVRSISWD